MDTITAKISGAAPYMSVTCTELGPSSYFPDAATVIFVDFSLVAPSYHESELICMVTVKNGDTVRLRQQQTFESVDTYKYTAQDAPMNAIEELQALMEISASVKERNQVYLYLPPVIYEGGLVMEETVFEDNGEGLWFNSAEASVSDNYYTNNIFRNNETGVPLESVPSDKSLYFPGTRFEGNGTDIDNRCDQTLGLDEAVFE